MALKLITEFGQTVTVAIVKQTVEHLVKTSSSPLEKNSAITAGGNRPQAARSRRLGGGWQIDSTGWAIERAAKAKA